MSRGRGRGNSNSLVDSNDSLEVHMDFDDDQTDQPDGQIVDGYENTTIDVVSVAQSDLFLINMYKYFLGKGYRNIIVTQVVNLLLVTFLVMFSIWLFSCVNFGLVMSISENSTNVRVLNDVVDWSALGHMHWYLVVCLVLFCGFFVWKVVKIVYDVQKMKEMQRFYNDDLQISDFELATIRWQKVVDQLHTLQEQHHFYLGKDTFTAHNVANHILKKENYLVAMFNKDLFDFTIPYVNISFFTKTMEWNLQHAVVNYLFDDRMKLKKEFMDYNSREQLANGLQKRLTLMAVLNLVFAPFLGLFLLFWGVFERGQEFYKTPTKLTSRRFSHLAKWKFREFNELPHVFYERMKLSHKYADDYLQQFPNYYVSDIAKLVAFILSTWLFVLFVAMIFNDFILFNLELGFNRSVFWWMGILSTVLLLVRGLIKDTFIFFPEKKLKKVADYIHYIPDEWLEKASHYSVRSQFLALYEYRLWVMLKEILGIIVNPLLMLVRFRKDTLQIVDFVRDYTLAHPELGHVCKFSVFEVGPENMMHSQRLSHLHSQCNQKKLEKSMYYFNQPVKETRIDAQSSLLDMSVFGANPPLSGFDIAVAGTQVGAQNNRNTLQETLQNFNDLSFAPSAAPTTIASSQFVIANVPQLYQRRPPTTMTGTTGTVANAVTTATTNPTTTTNQSTFLPSVLIKPHQPQELQTFGSGNLLRDIEAQMEHSADDNAQPTMMDLFFGTKK